MTTVFANNATSSLAAGITSGATTLTIPPADAGLFPAPSAGDWFPVTVTDHVNMEIMRCTARSGATLTVVRAQEGTVAAAFATGSIVEHRLTKAAIVTFLQVADWSGITGKPATFPPTLPIPQSGVSGLDASLAAKAPLDSPGLTGTPTTPTAAPGTANNQIASTSFVVGAVAANVEDWSTITGKPTTFPPTLPIAQADVTGLIAALALKAPLDSPVFSGNPTAPTPSLSDNDLSIATTAFVQGNLAIVGGRALVSDTPPVSPVQGQLWWDSASGNCFVWYVDPSGVPGQWVISNSVSGMPGDVEEAPIDGVAYERKDGGWVVATGGGGGSGSTAWADITGKPATFPPTVPIAQADITNLTTDLAAKLPKSGGTMTGAISIPGFSQTSAAIHFGNVGTGLYGDTGAIALTAGGEWKLYAAAGTIGTTVPITLVGDPTAAMHAATKQYVDLRELASNKGVVNGYASLDGTGMVPSGQLPSYVDDVREFANLAAFPATGMTGIIYIALDTNKVYRWSGSAYIEIVSSPGSTDAVPEGSVNLYYTDARVAAAAGVTAKVAKAGDTMTGTLILPAGAAATPALKFDHATTGLIGGGSNLGFVTNGVARLTLSQTALTSTLPIVLPSANPSSGTHAAHKNYVDTKEPTIAAGTTAQYWRGDKSWQTLPASEPPIATGTATLFWRGDKTWGRSFVEMTQAAYDALGSKDANTLYVIVG